MSFKSKTTFRQNYLNPAIKLGYVRLENPDSPNAPNQRYGLTLKGKALYYERHDSDNDVQNDPQNDPQTNLSGQNHDPINDPINGTINDTINESEKLIYNRIVSSPGISAVALADEFNKSVRTIMRVLKHLVELNIIEYRGSKKTGGYFSL